MLLSSLRSGGVLSPFISALEEVVQVHSLVPIDYGPWNVLQTKPSADIMSIMKCGGWTRLQCARCSEFANRYIPEITSHVNG